MILKSKIRSAICLHLQVKILERSRNAQRQIVEFPNLAISNHLFHICSTLEFARARSILLSLSPQILNCRPVARALFTSRHRAINSKAAINISLQSRRTRLCSSFLQPHATDTTGAPLRENVYHYPALRIIALIGLFIYSARGINWPGPFSSQRTHVSIRRQRNKAPDEWSDATARPILYVMVKTQDAHLRHLLENFQPWFCSLNVILNNLNVSCLHCTS